MDGILTTRKNAFLESLKAQGYVEGSIKNYRLKLNSLERYIAENAIDAYSSAVGEAFWEHKKQTGRYSKGHLQHIKVAIRRFNEFVFEDRYVLWQTSCRRECPPEFNEDFDKYLNHRRLVGIRERTIIIDQKQCVRLFGKGDKPRLITIPDVCTSLLKKLYEKCQSGCIKQ